MSLALGFENRLDAGSQLAQVVKNRGVRNSVVIGLPRGGVPVAAQVAQALGAPLDVIVVRKLGAASNPEFGFGAISEDGIQVVDRDIIDQLGLTAEQIEEVVTVETETLQRRITQIRTVQPQIPLAGKTVIIVDDGIATGIDARAACRVARKRGAKDVMLAVPVAPTDWRERLKTEADEFIAVIETDQLSAVGQFYADFAAVEDEEVLNYILRAHLRT